MSYFLLHTLVSFVQVILHLCLIWALQSVWPLGKILDGALDPHNLCHRSVDKKLLSLEIMIWVENVFQKECFHALVDISGLMAGDQRVGSKCAKLRLVTHWVLFASTHTNRTRQESSTTPSTQAIGTHSQD